MRRRIINMDYESYMLEHILEKIEGDEFTEGVKAKENYYFKENLIPLVLKAMTPDNVNKVIEFTGDFINSHADQLFDAGPIKTFTFGDKETSFLYNMIDISKDQLLEMFNEMKKQVYDYDLNTEVITSAPHKILITAMLVWAIQNNNEDIVECCKLLIVLAEYPMIYRKYWPFGVREDIMNYTVEHLSSKNIIKKKNNLLNYLQHHGEVPTKNHRDRLKTGMDHSYVDYINAIRSQMNAAFNKIKDAYTKNHEANATEKATKSKTEEGDLAEQNSLSSSIGNLAENTCNKIRTAGTNERIAKAIAENVDISKEKLVAYLNRIFSTKNNNLYGMVESIISLFLHSNPVDDKLGSGVFLTFGLALYRSIGTSKDPMKQKISKILVSWVDDILELRKEYPNRDATVIGYRSAIFKYIVFAIQHHN